MTRNASNSARRFLGAIRCVQVPRIAATTLALSCAALSAPASAAPVSTAFTYQGQIVKNGSPYQGQADLVFRLFNVVSGSGQVGTDVTVTSLTVPTGGVITVNLDFGPVFNGTALWLEVLVRTPPDGSYTTLTPRQALTASPFALHALNGASQWVTGGDGADLSYLAGGVAVTGASSPFASGRGVYLEGYDDGGYVFGYDYDNSRPLNLILNSPGGNVGIGTTNPPGKLTAVGGTVGVWGIGYGSVFVGGYQCGVYGEGQTGSADAHGVIGASVNAHGVIGITNTTANGAHGVTGQNNASGTYGWLGGPLTGVHGRAANASQFSGYFDHVAPNGVCLRAEGLAQVKTLQILGADLAESFPVHGGKAEPGTVLALADGADGELRLADEPYSRRVAGVVSGANGLDAGVVLKGQSFDTEGHASVALSGRVWVKCDATRDPIRVGDLLTTADRPGHAMVAADRDRAYGAILGKAMTSLEAGTGMVLVLVSLQ